MKQATGNRQQATGNELALCVAMCICFPICDVGENTSAASGVCVFSKNTDVS